MKRIIMKDRMKTSSTMSMTWVLLCCVQMMLPRAEGQCPPSCICDGETTACTRSDIPRNIPESTVQFIMTRSTVQTVESGIFDGELLPNLRKIYLSDSGIEEIQPGAFSNMEAIEEIHLSGNDIEELVERTFSGLRLESLHLNANKHLSVIHQDAFFDTTIQELHLRECNISTLDTDTFKTMSESLKMLFITNNTMPLDLPSGLFSRFRFTELDLSDNDFLISSLEAFRDMSAVILDLSNNCLGDFVWRIIDYVNSVHDLVLKRVCTNITEIAKDVQLISLSLEGNYIKEVTPEHFRYAPKLESLILRNNELARIPQDLGYLLESLRILDLSGNRITSLVLDDLDPFFALKVLDLKNNFIQTMANDLLPVFTKLQSFDIRDNPLHCNCELQWLAEWKRTLSYNDTTIKIGTCANQTIPFNSLRPSLDFKCTEPMILFSVTFPVLLDRQATFKCRASGDPAPSISLSLNDEVLESEPANEDRMVRQTNLEYTIENFGCSGIGTYTCSATNIAGTADETETVGQNINPRRCPVMTTESTPSSTTTETTTTSTPSVTADTDTVSTTSASTSTTSDQESTSQTSTTSSPSTSEKTKAETEEEKEAPVPTSTSPTDPAEKTKSSGTKSYVIPVVVVVVLLVVLAIVVVIVVLVLKVKGKLYNVDGRPHQPKVAHVNEGLEVTADGKPKA